MLVLRWLGRTLNLQTHFYNEFRATQDTAILLNEARCVAKDFKQNVWVGCIAVHAKWNKMAVMGAVIVWRT